MEKEVYEENIDELLQRLSTKPESGLSSEEAASRIRKYGQNITSKEKKRSLFKIFLSQFKGFIIYILLFAAILSLAIGEKAEFFVILIIILFSLVLSFFMEYKATRDMESLRHLMPNQSKVLRNFIEQTVPSSELVVGDIILLNRGDVVPADARIISCVNLKVDESTMTGESENVAKHSQVIIGKKGISEQKNMVFGSSHIMEGHALCVVVKTGKDTEIGKISEAMAGMKNGYTPLQKKLNRLGKQITIGVFIMCFVILVLGIINRQPFEALLLLVISIAVAGIPESLPTVVAVTLSVGIKRMAKQNAIIKKIPSVETLGECTVICTDKTGTLTQNKMMIEKIFTFDSEILVTGSGFEPKGLFMREEEVINPHSHLSLLKIIEIGVLCNNSHLKKREDEWYIDGESTEGALVVLAEKAGIDKIDFHKKFPRVHEHPFDSVRKCMSTIHTVKDKPIVYCKGAPELLIKKSSFYLDKGKVRKIDDKFKENVLSKIDEYASSGLRVIGLAYKEHKGKTFELRHVESSLIFAGLVGMKDPPEKSAFESVKLCNEAGIKVVMVTGDNKMTAMSIAKDLLIFREGDRVITGDELDLLSDSDFFDIIDKVTVYARTSPFHKLRIVETLQKKGHIVAMTGDGVNDAPALKKADIGVAMGKRGTEVAKEAAEMIIKDDNFATIVKAVKEGRTIYSNMRKFVYYLLPTNISFVLIILIAALLGLVPPLTPLMILFINLIADDIPSLGLSLEKAPPKIMLRKPRDPKEEILNDYMLLRIGQLVPLIVLGTLSLYLWELLIRNGGVEKAQTVAFATIALFGVFHIFNARSFSTSIFSKQFFSNPTIVISSVLSIIVTLYIIYVPGLQHIFGTVSLALKDWIPIILMSSVIIIYVEVQKIIIKTELKEREKLKIHTI